MTLHDGYDYGRYMHTYATFSNAVGVTGVLIGMIGLFFALRGLAKPSLRCEENIFRLIDKESGLAPDDLDITYRGESVDVLSKHILTIWNAGRKTLHREDIAASDPLRISLLPRAGEVDTKSRFLRVRILKRTRHVNAVNASIENDKLVKLDFDFLDHRDGAIIEVLHDGRSDVVLPLGTVKGVGKSATPAKLVRLRVFRNSHSHDEIDAAALIATTLASVYVPIVATITVLYIFRTHDWASHMSLGISWINFVLLTLVASFEVGRYRRRSPRELNLEASDLSG